MNPPQMRNLLTAALLLTTAMTTPAASQEVTLRSQDGSIAVTGQLLDFDGRNYTLRSSLGELRLSADSAVCEGAACPDLGSDLAEFSIVGANELVTKLTMNFLSSYAAEKGAQIDVTTLSRAESDVVIKSADGDALVQASLQGADSTTGLAALLGGRTDFALTTRPVRARELRDFEAAGLGNLTDPSQEHIIALDGLVIVTAPTNPVNAITEQNVAEVFAGRITNWRELGGRDAPINVYIRDLDTGTTETFDRLVMRPAGLELKQTGLRVATDTALAQSVANDPNGIGFTNFNGLAAAKPLAIEGVCGLQTPATPFTIQTEEYPLTRLLYMYTRDESQMAPGTRAFLNYVQSDAAQGAVSGAGLIDQLIASRAIDNQGLRFASAIVANNDIASYPELSAMVAEMLTAQRLSTTFRFQIGSSQLDPRASADIDRLAAYLSQNDTAGKEVLLIGFTDSVGDANRNKELSQNRANQVLATLLERHPDLQQRVTFITDGYGEISPLGCNETALGRRINRRVEVWIRDAVVRS